MDMHPDRRDEFELRSLDFLGDEQDLRAAALADLAAVGGRAYRTPQYEEAADSTNCVRVAVDQKGAVVDVYFRSDWRAQLTPQSLGPVLLRAHQNATAAMLNAFALASLAKRKRNTTSGDDEPQQPQDLAEAPEPGIAEIWRMLSDVEDMMHRAHKLSRQAPTDIVRTVYSPFGLFKATCQGRRLTSIITANLVLVQKADSERLRSAALELFRQAQHVTGRKNL